MDTKLVFFEQALITDIYLFAKNKIRGVDASAENEDDFAKHLAIQVIHGLKDVTFQGNFPKAFYAWLGQVTHEAKISAEAEDKRLGSEAETGFVLEDRCSHGVRPVGNDTPQAANQSSSPGEGH